MIAFCAASSIDDLGRGAHPSGPRFAAVAFGPATSRRARLRRRRLRRRWRAFDWLQRPSSPSPSRARPSRGVALAAVVAFAASPSARPPWRRRGLRRLRRCRRPRPSRRGRGRLSWSRRLRGRLLRRLRGGLLRRLLRRRCRRRRCRCGRAAGRVVVVLVATLSSSCPQPPRPVLSMRVPAAPVRGSAPGTGVPAFVSCRRHRRRPRSRGSAPRGRAAAPRSPAPGGAGDTGGAPRGRYRPAVERREPGPMPARCAPGRPSPGRARPPSARDRGLGIGRDGLPPGGAERSRGGIRQGQRLVGRQLGGEAGVEEEERQRLPLQRADARLAAVRRARPPPGGPASGAGRAPGRHAARARRCRRAARAAARTSPARRGPGCGAAGRACAACRRCGPAPAEGRPPTRRAA